MHALEVIRERNLAAAGREAGEAANNGEWERASRIRRAAEELTALPAWNLFVRAFWRAREAR